MKLNFGSLRFSLVWFFVDGVSLGLGGSAHVAVLPCLCLLRLIEKHVITRCHNFESLSFSLVLMRNCHDQ